MEGAIVKSLKSNGKQEARLRYPDKEACGESSQFGPRDPGADVAKSSENQQRKRRRLRMHPLCIITDA